MVKKRFLLLGLTLLALTAISLMLFFRYFPPTGVEGLVNTSASGYTFTSLTNPRMVPAAKATWLTPDEYVLGVIQNDDIRAYPINQAWYHHIINDTIGGEPYLVTY